MTQEEITKAVGRYIEIRDKAYKHIKANPECMGKDEWLRYAIIEGDMNIHANLDGLRIWGTTYTTQTMGNEWFDFTIPYSAIG